MPLMIFGGSGYIGSAFITELNRRGYQYLNISRKNHDYTNPVTLHHLLLIHRPEFVINAAGFTGTPNVDECESRRAETLLANTIFPANLAAECSRMAIPFGHVSSGCIYNGYPPGGYRETDPPDFNPASWYSATKMLAEEILINHRCYIWRLRMPFDEFDHPKNYLSKLISYNKLVDGINSMSHRSECVASCIDLWEKNAPYGTYHVVNPNRWHWPNVMEIVGQLKRRGLITKQPEWVSREEFSTMIRAPRSFCMLNTEKLSQFSQLRYFEDALEQSIRSWQPRSE